jgi:hypothetical protein
MFRIKSNYLYNMKHKLNTYKIITEWAHRLTNGTPDVHSGYHLETLRQVLVEQNYPREFIQEYINNLQEDSIVKNIKSGNEYVVQSHNPETQTLVTKDASPEEIENLKNKDTKDKQDNGTKASPENQKIVGDFNGRINDRIENLSDGQKVLVKEASEKINTLYNDNATPKQQKLAAQWLVDKAGFSANEMPSTGKRKAYLNKLGGNRKILGNGTANTEGLVQKIESLIELRTFDAKSIKTGFSTAAKPDLGDENIAKPKDDPKVNEYFSRHPILQKIRGGLHGIYAVKDENGNVKMPSSEYSKDYLAQSFRSPSLQNTIAFAKRQTADGNIDERVLTSLEAHQNNLNGILETYEIPGEQAKQAVADSYNNLMVALHKADPDIANSIMKQVAENNLYEQELANGEEVYLPSAGNFPAGDKIKGGTTERVSLISCKFGKNGRIYGCPANSKTICELHPDESKQNNQGQYLGEVGHTLLINDNLIRGGDREETKEKTKGFIKNSLTEVDLGDVFSDTEITQISEISTNYMGEIDRIKQEVADSNPPDKTEEWKAFSKKLAEIEGKYKQQMAKVVTKEHAAKLIGENNAPNLVQNAGVKIESILSAIEIANNIRTNTSLLELEHNKQFYDDNDRPEFVTSKGTQNPNDYSITFRTKRTAGRTGGGCQLSFTGDGAPAKNNLQDDGSLTDAKTGLDVEI